MAALGADSKINYSGLSPRQTKPFIIANAAQLYVGSLLKIASGFITNFATGATVFGVAVAGGVPGSNPVMDGFDLQSLPLLMIGPGNASSAAAGNANQAIVEQGAFTWEQVTLAVAGSLAGSQADVGVTLYAGSDNIEDSLTTQPGSDKPLGQISRFYSTATTTAIYDIFVFDYESRLGM